ncbi:hypothetical protein CB0940_08006 [Cercospora beticola]|uniref:F-box domain-containing protein n=1 Tax=Cercospora beticola TaxID=122368 RepID=A0A2G5HNV9_CERBT|nr:hypothetical protein CB0940_08006 [Cercospora beticola]PIA94237.1 hypothetical protein CB0940_08006 [Cercospora beticola]WPB04560.1 hypothetical protein RHO25_009206 [Cercospora beticola]CAK1364304.1 unnamed protein product [Cercospora beticola]
MAAQNATERAFQIPELLELILAYLAPRDLLLSQRTTRSFRNTIQGSVILRRKLFLEPDWKLEDRLFSAHATSKGSVSRPGRKPENNRLLLRAFPGCYPTITLVIISNSINRQARFGVAGSHSQIVKSPLSEQWSWDVCISFPADARPEVPAAVDHPEASWRKMYLCQPPCSELYLVRRWQRGLRPAIIRDGGIRMGDFVDEATKPKPGLEGRDWHVSYISSDRDWHFEGSIKCSSVEV